MLPLPALPQAPYLSACRRRLRCSNAIMNSVCCTPMVGLEFKTESMKGTVWPSKMACSPLLCQAFYTRTRSQWGHSRYHGAFSTAETRKTRSRDESGSCRVVHPAGPDGNWQCCFGNNLTFVVQKKQPDGDGVGVGRYRPSNRNEFHKVHGNQEMSKMAKRCPRCEGKGTIRCKTCGGLGTVYPLPITGIGASKCSKCKGTGELRCPACNGRGTVA